jgi:putative endonuclease
MALKYLKKQRLNLIEKNFNCRCGEIDLIMADQDYLVFVEVRYRRNPQFGGALESVNYHKQLKLRRSAELYLQLHKKTDAPCRFDILCIDGEIIKPTYQWVQNAF